MPHPMFWLAERAATCGSMAVMAMYITVFGWVHISHLHNCFLQPLRGLRPKTDSTYSYFIYHSGVLPPPPRPLP